MVFSRDSSTPWFNNVFAFSALEEGLLISQLLGHNDHPSSSGCISDLASSFLI